MKKSLAYIIILVVGVVIGNFLTELKYSYHHKSLKKNSDDILSLLHNTKTKSNSDSISCNQTIEKLSVIIYDLQEENSRLKKSHNH
ncbi:MULTISPECIES: hypothetical protein [unclassified Chryseobacterium]|uniref:hypothetical protein n=1 Tax=unclassified Chryseobacterium TaxID=2593645 RepID=UPI00226A470C|nr:MULTISPECIES: hypothetical protein [unclassified Chryseobacterium]